MQHTTCAVQHATGSTRPAASRPRAFGGPTAPPVLSGLPLPPRPAIYKLSMRTAPSSAGSALRFIVGGDTGSNENVRALNQCDRPSPSAASHPSHAISEPCGFGAHTRAHTHPAFTYASACFCFRARPHAFRVVCARSATVLQCVRQCRCSVDRRYRRYIGNRTGRAWAPTVVVNGGDVAYDNGMFSCACAWDRRARVGCSGRTPFERSGWSVRRRPRRARVFIECRSGEECGRGEPSPGADV